LTVHKAYVVYLNLVGSSNIVADFAFSNRVVLSNRGCYDHGDGGALALHVEYRDDTAGAAINPALFKYNETSVFSLDLSASTVTSYASVFAGPNIQPSSGWRVGSLAIG
jgi:hypothetical protein